MVLIHLLVQSVHHRQCSNNVPDNSIHSQWRQDTQLNQSWQNLEAQEAHSQNQFGFQETNLGNWGYFYADRGESLVSKELT